MVSMDKARRRGRAMSLWATYRWGDRSCALDDIDIMWLAKSLWGECGKGGEFEDMLAVACCMMQRYLRWKRANVEWGTFSSFVRAFSQPVNPIWVDPSPYRRRKYPKLCTPARLRRRRTICNAPWVDVPRAPKLVAMGFGCGMYASPVPDAVNFGAAALIKRQGRKGINLGGNVFIDPSQDKGIKWTKGSLEIII